MEECTLRPIAHIQSAFAEKFGIPRQSGLVESLPAQVVFEPEFRSAEALRGLEEYSHIWLIWHFSANRPVPASPTVRPPRLGGKHTHGGVRHALSLRPNPLGLSCVRLTSIELSTPQAPVLHVAGADLMDKTPIFDIKPICPTSTANRTRWAAFPRAQKRMRCRWISRRSCSYACLRRCASRCARCWRRTPAPPIKTTPRAYTALPLRSRRSISPYRTVAYTCAAFRAR